MSHELPRTLVLQSYRTDDVPAWITRCLRSVESWARFHQLDYRFSGDEFFDIVGEEFARLSRGSIHLMSDYARLLHSRRFLEEGYDRVVWMDADIFVFEPEALSPPLHDCCCREHYWWIADPQMPPQTQTKLSNAFLVFRRSSALLELYLKACEGIVKGGIAERKQLAKSTVVLDLGPDFLTRLNRVRAVAAIPEILHFMPDLLESVAAGGGSLAERFMMDSDTPYYAAHLCLTAYNRVFSDQNVNATMDHLSGSFGQRLATLKPSVGSSR